MKLHLHLVILIPETYKNKEYVANILKQSRFEMIYVSDFKFYIWVGYHKPILLLENIK